MRKSKSFQTTWFTEFEKETEDVETKAEMKRGRGRPRKNKANDVIQITDDDTYALLANINGDPVTYKEAVNGSDRLKWTEAIESELESLNKNQVWKLVDRSSISRENGKLNIIDSRWVLKRKIEPDNTVRYKARLVIRGFKDCNEYELQETYAPVSRLPLIRAISSYSKQM